MPKKLPVKSNKTVADATRGVVDAARPKASAAERADVALGAQMAARRDHPFVRAAAAAGELTDQGPLYILGAAVLAGGLAARSRRVAATGAGMLAATAAADGGKSVVKRLVRRTRPHVLLDERRYAAGVGQPATKHEQSFPSGHAACSVAAALAAARHYPAAGRWGAVAAVLLAVARVARGAHWPLDVAAGVVIGVAAEAASDRVVRAVGRRVTRKATKARRP